MKTSGLLLTIATLCVAVASAMLILTDTWRVHGAEMLATEASQPPRHAAVQEGSNDRE